MGPIRGGVLAEKSFVKFRTSNLRLAGVSTPLETGDLLLSDIVVAARAELSRLPGPMPPVIEKPTEVVILRREVGLNGERYAPGRHVVPVSKAAGLRSIEAGR